MIDESQIRTIVERVLKEIGNLPAGSSDVHAHAEPQGDGIFATLDEAVTAAQTAQQNLASRPLALRHEIVAALRATFRRDARRLAELTVADTGMGRVEDKVTKNLLSTEKTFGPEDLQTQAVSGDYGLTLTELAPFGVIGSITPSTNPVATVINHVIGMISAGNSVVFNPHPSAAKCTLEGIRVANRAIVSAGGPANLATACAQPSLRTAKELMTHPKVNVLVATGGRPVVKACMESGKKTIAAGPGNPPAVVDDTANIPKAAQLIIDGASFDNNLPCVCEKEVIVMNAVADRLVEEMKRRGCHELSDTEIQSLMRVILTPEGHVNKNFVGKDAAVILAEIGVRVGPECKLAIAQVPKSHPFVQEELLMPVLPIVRVNTFDEAIATAVEVEHGFRHTAMIHSICIERITRFAKAIDCNLFVANGSCGASLGHEAEGHTTMTVAGPTGEGVTRPRTFTRERRIVLKGVFHVV